MVCSVAEYCDLPVIVGGGIRQPEQAAARVAAGASFIVIGTAHERNDDIGFMAAMAEAVHITSQATV